MMTIDLWKKGEKIAAATCLFLPNSGAYVGNLYNAEGRIIGDFWSNNSVEIEKRFRELKIPFAWS